MSLSTRWTCTPREPMIWPCDSARERERSSLVKEPAQRLRELRETRSDMEYIFVIERLKMRCALEGCSCRGMSDYRTRNGEKRKTYDG